jgi:hypothetical protein
MGVGVVLGILNELFCENTGLNTAKENEKQMKN